ncbi:probable dipeptidyl-peptidase 5 isoform X2 [Salvia miltiorrhiza]|uniref:probable dipeptidyl-peptidase 5 isoform X2 n=1 Tax=Salvia miltiorrhiza TaxID=226208 RepID=UPI0025AC49A9|nr:probable dipeptidyl-peptidase 5 isoform X2 [Salvia miltiorrhiza]
MAFCAVITLSRHCRPPLLLPHLHISRVHHAPKLPFYCRRRASTITMSSASETKLTAPYGSWTSPITADVVSGSAGGLGGFATDSLGRLYWLESRPTESGRNVLVRQADNENDEPIDITPKDFAVRTVAQEYGGGAFSISGDSIIFSNYRDQRLYKQSISSKDSAPVPLTPDYNGPHVCYADGVFDFRLNCYVTVMEDRRESSTCSITTIVSVDLRGNDIKEPKILVEGNDFYAFPRIDHKGERMAWIEWSHPNMPWDKSELWVGYISENGDIKKKICVAGGNPSILESLTEPKWSPEGELFFISDRKSGFWNIYKWVESTNEVLPVYTLNAEFTKPLWVFGSNSYDFLQTPDQKNLISCSYRMNGSSYLAIVDVMQSKILPLDIPFTDINNIQSGLDCLYVEGASASHPLSIAKVILDDQKSKAVDLKIIWSSSYISPPIRSYISTPELIEFPTEVPGQSAYAYFYPPTNPLFQATQGERPPLLLKSHGGPTAEARGILNLSIQYWTSRGWAFVDVNYGGSTGYGREYRDRLLGRWGITDVNDCCSCAKFLVDSGKVDGERLCITGGSAGGYTTLAALAFRDTFRAGASLYGVADLKSLRSDTHKFESHYIDKLVGDENAYFERSPINFVDKFSCPMILFQGLEDKVVLPNQARKIYHALKDKGVPVALVEYEGEQHGFRKAENIKFTLEQQMLFFARLVGKFTVADDITPIKVDNLD